MVEVRLEDLRKTFRTISGTTVAVEGTNLTIEDGEFFTFVGPSGCGKTTTLRMIAGLETPTSGSIYFDDVEVTELTPQDRDIAMVFQDITLYPNMSVQENIGYGLKVRGETENYDEKIEDIAELLGIKELLDNKPGQLSGGQQQRVSLGRALVRDPNLILFDEPLSDLDAKLKNDLRVRIQRLHEQFGTTMIYVTHDQEEAITMSDRIAVMRDGKLAQVSTPEELFDSPASDFVGNFIGQPSMNFFRGARLDGNVIEFDSERKRQIVVDDGVVPDYAQGKEVDLGIRPQHISICDAGDGLFTAAVDVIEMIGTEHVVYLLDEDEEQLRVLVDDDPGFERGDEVGLTTPDKLYVFDGETGDRIVEIELEHIELRQNPKP